MNETNTVAETFWTDVSSNKAWKLAGVEGKTAPYCGYMLKLQSGDLRCIRTDNATRYQFKPAKAYPTQAIS